MNAEKKSFVCEEFVIIRGLSYHLVSDNPKTFTFFAAPQLITTISLRRHFVGYFLLERGSRIRSDDCRRCRNCLQLVQVCEEILKRLPAEEVCVQISNWFPRLIFFIIFRWRKIGEISDVWCYPVKSCGPVVLDEVGCGQIGPQLGHLRDRVFVVVRQDGETVTARTYPKMVLISPKIEGDVMRLSAPGMKDISVNITKLYSSTKTIKVKVWLDTAECIDCGDELAQWFTKFILGENVGFRLAFYPSSEPKPEVKDKNFLYDQADQKDSGALHDEASYLLMNQGSFDDLNTMIEQKVTPLQYRPNFVVKGPAAWDEDTWKWIKIGETIFKNVQPCTRCIFTNINPVNGERNPDMEPLKTLKTFRKFDHMSPSPIFGIHLGVRKIGKVRKGDQVYVGN